MKLVYKKKKQAVLTKLEVEYTQGTVAKFDLEQHISDKRVELSGLEAKVAAH